jgi:hypothetical protein
MTPVEVAAALGRFPPLTAIAEALAKSESVALILAAELDPAADHVLAQLLPPIIDGVRTISSHA